jgi:hypothetical protein
MVGRPRVHPDHAMTPAERQRRRRAKQADEIVARILVLIDRADSSVADVIIDALEREIAKRQRQRKLSRD